MVKNENFFKALEESKSDLIIKYNEPTINRDSYHNK